MGGFVWLKCLVAWRLGELSQHPTCPQLRHKRKWTQLAPIFKQSAHPLALGFTLWIWFRCAHLAIRPPEGDKDVATFIRDSFPDWRVECENRRHDTTAAFTLIPIWDSLERRTDCRAGGTGDSSRVSRHRYGQPTQTLL